MMSNFLDTLYISSLPSTWLYLIYFILLDFNVWHYGLPDIRLDLCVYVYVHMGVDTFICPYKNRLDNMDVYT